MWAAPKRAKFVAALLFLSAVDSSRPYTPCSVSRRFGETGSRAPSALASVLRAFAGDHPHRRRRLAFGHRPSLALDQWHARPAALRHRQPGGGRSECRVAAPCGQPARRARVARSAMWSARWSEPARRSAPPSARQELGYDGSGVGVAVIDSGITPGTTTSRMHAGGRSASLGSSTSSAARDAVRRLRARHARRRHHRRQRLRLGRRANRHRARSAPGRAEGARRNGPGIHQRRDRGARLRHRPPRGPEHPRHQPVGGDRSLRVRTTPIR